RSDRDWSSDVCSSDLSKFKLVIVGAFHNMIMDKIPERFPKLKVAFLEAGAQWLPYVLNDLGKRYKLQGRELDAKELLRQSRFYRSEERRVGKEYRCTV